MTEGSQPRSGNPDGRDTSRNSQIACPRCGRESGNLPLHLRSCDGEADD